MKRRTKKTTVKTEKARELSDAELALAVQTAHRDFIAAIAKCTAKGLRVDCGRDVGTPVCVLRPIASASNG